MNEPLHEPLHVPISETMTEPMASNLCGLSGKSSARTSVDGMPR